MPYRLTTSDPAVSAEEETFLSDLATFCKNNNIATQSQWESFISNLTATQMLALMKALLKRWVTVT